MRIMHLSADFYRALFDESFRKIEPSWQTDVNWPNGYRWINKGDPFREEFRIDTNEEGQLVLLFAVYLPDQFRDTEIYSEFAQVKSQLNLSIMVTGGSLRLASALRTGSERASLIEFIQQTRSEITCLLGRVVRRANKEFYRSPVASLK